MNKVTLNLDERNINIILRICTVLYILTLASLIVTQLNRQFVLHQATQEWQDIANIIAFNVIVLLGSVLYLGGITPQKVKLRQILVLYAGFVIIGVIFTIFKYAILLGQNVSLAEVRNYLLIVSAICGALIAVWTLLAYLGKKRIEKRLE
jgi:phosphoglycerol transferase MdoB-like AlkP superfamily enzyme